MDIMLEKSDRMLGHPAAQSWPKKFVLFDKQLDKLFWPTL